MQKTLFKNIVFDYDGEHMKDNGKILTEISIPVIVDLTTSLCHYPESFTLYEMDELSGHIVPNRYDKTPYYTGAMRNFTEQPKYAVPSMFSKYVS